LRPLHGQLDLAVGTAIGSNITNILLILGLAALLIHLPCILIFCAVNCR
jgi:Ca2+/Na+ antiporter